MKKILYIFSFMLLSVAACTRFEEETSPAFSSDVAAPSIEAVSDATHNADSAFTVKITPGKGNNYYTFAIIKGAADASLDGETLLTLGYLEKCVKVKLIREEVEVDVPLGGCFKASAQADTVVLAFDLTPDTEYTVYAIGNDALGQLSKIQTLTVSTTDKNAPVPYNAKGEFQFDDSALEEGTFVIQFDDNIELTDAFKKGTAKFHAHYFAANDVSLASDGETYLMNTVFTADVPVDSVALDGAKNVSIQLPERIPGAIVGITFDARVVRNPVGLSNKEFSDLVAYWDGDEVAVDGLGSRFETAEWEFSLPMIKDEEGKDVRMPADTVIYFTDYSELVLSFVAPELAEPLFQSGAPFNELVPMAAPQIRYTDSKNRRVINDAAENLIAVSDSTLYLGLAEAPDYGSSISVDIPKGAIEDIWGNPCAAFTTFYLDEDDAQFAGNYFCSYGYTLEDLLGQYAYKGESAIAPEYNEDGVWVIEKSNDEKKGNVMITTIFSFPCKSPIYCSFSVDSGKLTIPDSVEFYDYDDPEHADKGVLMTAWNNADSGTLTMKEPGKLSSLNNIFGYYGVSSVSKENDGWWNAFSAITAERTSGGTPVPAPAPKLKKARKAL